MIVGYDHVQVAIPAAREAAARGCYGELLAMTEMAKPDALAPGGGYSCVRSAGAVPGVRRFHTVDPFGNRLEFQQA